MARSSAEVCRTAICTPPAGSLPDLQASADERGISLQQVGIKEFALPMRVRTHAGTFQEVHTYATVSVSLPANVRGTHMSRFVEVLVAWQGRQLNIAAVAAILGEVSSRLFAPRAFAQIHFRYFIDKVAPATQLSAPTELNCTFEGEIDAKGAIQLTLGVVVPIMTLCPCSKAISRFGAHNQRSVLTARLKFRHAQPQRSVIGLEELAEGLERCGSCGVYPLLKRVDEKVVTERAFENPKFVEDVLREAILFLREVPEVTWFEVTCESFESIHNHNAWASHQQWVKPSL